MRNIALLCIIVVCSGFGRVRVQNVTSGALTAGTMTFPVGTTDVDLVPQVVGEWNLYFAATVGEVFVTNSYVATFSVAGGTLVQVGTASDNAGVVQSFWFGFVLVFVGAMMGLGARWTRRLVGGGSYE